MVTMWNGERQEGVEGEIWREGDWKEGWREGRKVRGKKHKNTVLRYKQYGVKHNKEESRREK